MRMSAYNIRKFKKALKSPLPLSFRTPHGSAAFISHHLAGAAVCGKGARVLTAARASREHQNERSGRYAASDSARKLDNSRLAAAIKATFAKRATHPIPRKLEPPPAAWEPVFEALARECDLDVGLPAEFETVRGFVGKILGRQTG
jgi:hypothetical protein